MRLSAFETYCKYLAIKMHFTSTYDYFKYMGKTRANLETFAARKDRFHYDRLSRKYDDSEMVDFLVANFKDGDKLWIGTLLTTGAEDKYKEHLKRIQSMTYNFKEELSKIGGLKGKFTGDSPIIVRMYLQNDISIETLIILDRILSFVEILDHRLKDDFEWPLISTKIKKLSPFLNIDIPKMSEIIKTHEQGLLNNA